MKTKRLAGTSGQALIEFAATSALAGAVCIAIGSGLRNEWTHLTCVHRLFEETHSRLVGGPPLPRTSKNSRIKIRISENEEHVMGEAFCRGRIEKLELPKLNSPRWRQNL